MTRPLLIVGDVQGDAERLDRALQPYPDGDVDTVFLGDFFQGGPPGEAGGAESARIAQRRDNAQSVLGNHDLMLLCVLEEVRTGWTPPTVAHFGKRSLAEIWLWRRGDWADLRAVADDPDLEAWLRSLPLMLRLPDGTLVQHCDDDAYTRLGADVDEVNRAAAERLQRPQGAWEVFWYTIGRKTFRDPARLAAHLDHFGATRVVHGHTPHHQDLPVASHDGRIWSFDGCFSRYWARGEGSSAGPIPATVNLLPDL
jgi:Calcineurin-like phosphoesterase